jgi:hypothetical protein
VRNERFKDAVKGTPMVGSYGSISDDDCLAGALSNVGSGVGTPVQYLSSGWTCGAGGGTSGPVTHTISVSFDGAGSALTPGKVYYTTVPYACIIARWDIHATGGTASVDVWRTATGSADPAIGNTITGSGTPTITSGTNAHGDATGWSSNSLSVNDNVAMSLTAVSGATQVSLQLQCNE